MAALASFHAAGASSPPTSREIALREGLAIGIREDLRGRTGMSLDPIEARLVAGVRSAPKNGAKVKFPEGEAGVWKAVRADEKGWFSGAELEGGYVYVPVWARRSEVLILEGMGHEMVFVNGTPRAGNPYGQQDEWQPWEPPFAFSRVPVLLERGRNDFFFKCYRGRLKANLRAPRSRAVFNAADTTLPDLVAGREYRTSGSIVVINASTSPLRGASILVAVDERTSMLLPVRTIPPLSLHKAIFPLHGRAPVRTGDLRVTLKLLEDQDPEGKPLDTVKVDLEVVAPGEAQKRTFISAIDGSVQHYAINPPRGYTGRLPDRTIIPTISAEPTPPKFHSDGLAHGAESSLVHRAAAAPLATGAEAEAPAAPAAPRARPVALVLSLHGAGVEAANQARSYAPKPWALVVAPTNRRPYGYNWEDWGRLDALEVMEIVQKEWNIDPDRIYLTGHSMGGHGTWHLGEMFPDRFAAIGPSAGWLSFWTYRARREPEGDTPIGRILRRAASPSDTLALAENLRRQGVYVLHGSDDDNVPVSESRRMVERLAEFHRDFVYHEQKGAGHWWDLSDAPGADCVDWPEMFDFFARHARPGAGRVRQVDFLTASPGISARCDWLSIEAQTEPLAPSSVSVRCDPETGRFTGRTHNVARLALDLEHLERGSGVSVEMDEQVLEGFPRPAHKGRLWLGRGDGKWSVVAEPTPALKGPHRYGTFKDAFRNRVLFVYGTRGTAEENAAIFEQTRYNAEKFWYQGNGAIEVVRDLDFDVSAAPDRNVVLYGNAETNLAWRALLGTSPVQVDRAGVHIGARTIVGPDLACLFIRPRPGSRTASVGAVAGTGAAGMRLAAGKLYLDAGYPFPDCIVFSAGLAKRSDDGIIAAGFFGLDWSLESGDFAWRPGGEGAKRRRVR